MDCADAYAPAEKERQRGSLFGFVSFEYNSRQLEPSKCLDVRRNHTPLEFLKLSVLPLLRIKEKRKKVEDN